MNLCKEENDYTRSFAEGTTRWVCQLNNGETIYQDGYTPNTWLRLKKYCEENFLYIISMYVHFRTHRIDLPENKEGYFFRQAAGMLLTDTQTQQFYLVGYIENDKLHVIKYRVPELIKISKEVRSIDDHLNSIIKR